MLLRLRAHITKELLLLLRDRAGLALLFLMPVALVMIMAVVQDAPFRDFNEHRIKVLLLDQDGGPVGKRLRDRLDSSSFIVTDARGLTSGAFHDAVRRGDQQVGIIVPRDASAALESRSRSAIMELFPVAPLDSLPERSPADSTAITLLIDPTVKHAFRQLVQASVSAIITELSAERLLDEMRNSLESATGDSLPRIALGDPFIRIRQEIAAGELIGVGVAQDSTQHNVPAWTVFAMFFTVVLLGGNLVKERQSGCMVRLLTMPGATAERIASRIMAYLLVCLMQAVLLGIVGRWVLPLLGLPQLWIEGPGMLALLLMISGVVALAATSFGVLVGALSRSQQQSAVLGSTCVVILSAIGGIWVPLYIMPAGMQLVGRMSPLHWGMEAYNAVLLRGGGISDLLPLFLPLVLFGAACIGLAIISERIASSR